MPVWHHGVITNRNKSAFGDLIKNPTIIKVLFLNRFPSAKILNGHQVQGWKHPLKGFGNGGITGTVKMLGSQLLSLWRVQGF
jgi:hypothetical protein